MRVLVLGAATLDETVGSVAVFASGSLGVLNVARICRDNFTLVVRFIMFIDCVIVLKKAPLIPARKHIVHCSLRVIVDCESNAIPVPPITAGGAKLSD